MPEPKAYLAESFQKLAKGEADFDIVPDNVDLLGGTNVASRISTKRSKQQGECFVPKMTEVPKTFFSNGSGLFQLESQQLLLLAMGTNSLKHIGNVNMVLYTNEKVGLDWGILSPGITTYHT